MKKFWDEEWTGVIGMLAGCFLVGMAAGALFGNLAYPYRGQEADLLGGLSFQQTEGRKDCHQILFLLSFGTEDAGLSFLCSGGAYGSSPAKRSGRDAGDGFSGRSWREYGGASAGNPGSVIFSGGKFSSGNSLYSLHAIFTGRNIPAEWENLEKI